MPETENFSQKDEIITSHLGLDLEKELSPLFQDEIKAGGNLMRHWREAKRTFLKLYSLFNPVAEFGFDTLLKPRCE